MKAESKGTHQIIYRLLHGLQTGPDNVALLRVLVRMPCSHETDTFPYAGREQGTPPHFQTKGGLFSAKYKTGLGSARSPAQRSHPPPGEATSMDERVFSSPPVFTYSAVALSAEAPSTKPAGRWWVTCLLGTAWSPLACYAITLTSQEMTATSRHSQV